MCYASSYRAAVCGGHQFVRRERQVGWQQRRWKTHLLSGVMRPVKPAASSAANPRSCKMMTYDRVDVPANVSSVRASQTVTLAPRLARAIAAHTPAGPAPTTTTLTPFISPPAPPALCVSLGLCIYISTRRRVRCTQAGDKQSSCTNDLSAAPQEWVLKLARGSTSVCCLLRQRSRTELVGLRGSTALVSQIHLLLLHLRRCRGHHVCQRASDLVYKSGSQV